VLSTVAENAVTGAHRSRALARAGWFRRGAVTRAATELVARHRVRTAGVGAPAGSLSGGNQQKLILGRELERQPRLLVAAQPTRGVDIAGAAAIRGELARLRDRGGAVLLVSEELDELVALSDRIVVLADGRVSGELVGAADDYAALGRLMTRRGAGARRAPQEARA
jgi:simple sugar transport system ATP-binding protein